jgi:acetylornithine/N-succinyldiaminopimelate aminotransferase
MVAGVHGSTFGGNPLAMAVAEAAFDEISRPETLANAQLIGRRLAEGLARIAADHPSIVVDIRGKGMLIGVKLAVNNREFMAAARRHRLLVAGGGDNCVRMLPSLLMREDEADLALERFAATVAGFAAMGERAA